jgi:elongation factor Ts
MTKILKREGVVRSYVHHNNRTAVLVEVSSDSDFVARNKEFLTFVDNLALHIAAENPKSKEELLTQPWLMDDSKIIQDVINEQKKLFKEKIDVISFTRHTLDPEEQKEKKE